MKTVEKRLRKAQGNLEAGSRSINDTSKRKSKLSERMVKLKDGCPKVCFIIFVIKRLFISFY